MQQIERMSHIYCCRANYELIFVLVNANIQIWPSRDFRRDLHTHP